MYTSYPNNSPYIYLCLCIYIFGLGLQIGEIYKCDKDKDGEKYLDANTFSPKQVLEILINRNFRFEPNGSKDHDASAIQNLNKYCLKKTELEIIKTVDNSQHDNQLDETVTIKKQRNREDGGLPVQEVMTVFKYEIDSRHKEFLKLAPTKDYIDCGRWIDFDKDIYNGIKSDGKFRCFSEYADKKEWKRAFGAGLAEEKYSGPSAKKPKYKTLDEKFEAEYEKEFLNAFNKELRGVESGHRSSIRKKKKANRKKMKKLRKKNASPIRTRISHHASNQISKSILQLPKL